LTDVENIQRLIKSIFGVEKKIRSGSHSNKCISPLNKKPYNLFARNFVDRLRRLQKKYAGDESAVNDITERVKNIAEARNSQWAGPYSELVALDFYSQFSEFFDVSYINVLPSSQHKNSIPAINGQETIDIDLCLHLKSGDIYTDVKSFNCVHQNILDEVFEAVEEYAMLSLKKSVMIGVDNLSSIDYSEVKINLGSEKKKIYRELVKAVTEDRRVVAYENNNGIHFTIRIEYSDMISTVKEYSPFAMAEAYKYKFLDYGSKLLDDEYSVITMVRNNWFNEETVDFGDFNNYFYRALARRTFVELKNIDESARLHSRGYDSDSIKVSDISRNLAGIIFIDDFSHETRRAEKLYNAYFYLNPNYINKTPLSIRMLEKNFRNYLECQIKDFDDFKWDNY